MVFGSPERQRLTVNHVGVRKEGNRKSHLDHLVNQWKLAHDLAKVGRVDEARTLAERVLHQPMTRPGGPALVGELTLSFPDHAKATDYRRELDLSTGITRTTYRIGDSAFTIEAFAQATGGPVAIRLESRGPMRFTGTIELSRPRDPECHLSSWSAPGFIGLSGEFVDNQPFRLNAAALLVKQGEVRFLSARKATWLVDRVREMLILVNVDLTDEDPYALVDRYERDQPPKDYQWYRLIHSARQRRRFQRARLKLGSAQSKSPSTESLLESARTAGRITPELAQHYVDLGRYLLMSVSRPSGIPASSTGLWRKEVTVPEGEVDHGAWLVTSWPAEVWQLADSSQPFLDRGLVRMPEGRRLSRTLYGREGITMLPTRSGITGTTVADEFARALWERYRFQGDRTYLASTAYPFLRDVARAVSESKSSFLFAPTVRPANIEPILERAVSAAKVLDVDPELQAAWRRQLERSRGASTLQKDPKVDEMPPTWRRLYPGDLARDAVPEPLANQIRRIAATSLDDANALPGWQRAWLACLLARLGDGDAALEQVEAPLLIPVASNLLGSHEGDSFRIDGAIVATAAVAEMLLQTHTGTVEVLPALPESWDTGTVEGLAARGGFEVDIDWRNGNIEKVAIRSRLGREIRLAEPAGKRWQIRDDNGNSVVGRRDAGVVTFPTESGQAYELIPIVDRASLPSN